MIARRSAVLATSGFATIAISFLTQWFLLTEFGATRQLDAYFAALTVPVMLIYVLGEPLFRVAVPTLAVRDRGEFGQASWTTFLLIGVLFLVPAILMGLTARWWVALLAPGFSADDRRLVISLVHILVVGMLLQGLSGAARCVWSARDRFEFPAVVSALAALLGLMFLPWAIPRFGVFAAAWAFNLRFLVECLALIPILGTYVSQTNALATGRRLLQSSRPLMLGAAYARTDVLVDRVLSSLAPPGALSLLYFAQQILAAIGQVLNQTFVAPLGPRLATLAHSERWSVFRETLRRTSVRLSFLVIGLAVLVPIAGQPLLSWVLSHKNMDPENVTRLMTLMYALTGLLLGDSLAYLVNNAFYAIGNTRTPAVATGVVYSILVPVKVGAFFLAGIIGVALSTSGYYLINAAVLGALLRNALRRVARAQAAGPGAVTPTTSPPPPVSLQP